MRHDIRRAVSDYLERYDTFANKGDFIEVTEWTNGEGIDIDLTYSNNVHKRISVTYGEFEAMMHVVKELQHYDAKDFEK